MELAPTPKDVIHREGTARLYRFRMADGRHAEAGPVVLLVPSVINRWYVLDLRPGASLVQALVAAGLDVFCLDWGTPEDEDRYLGWDDLLRRLGRAARIVARTRRVEKIGLLGYCMGGTLAGIHAALEPSAIGGLINLAGPFDFAKAGFLAGLTDPRWFDAEAIAAAGNVSALQMQSGFVALRPTSQLAKWIGFVDKAHDDASREAFFALEAWASDNIPFPAAAYATYIRELYQANALVAGRHHALGRRVDLSAIRCPVLTVVAERDAICPPAAATALNDASGAKDREVLSVPGGHVGAVVGTRASRVLYPRIAGFFAEKLGPRRSEAIARA